MYRLWWPVVWQTTSCHFNRLAIGGGNFNRQVVIGDLYNRLAVVGGRTFVFERLQTTAAEPKNVEIPSVLDNLLNTATISGRGAARAACECVISLGEAVTAGGTDSPGQEAVIRLRERPQFHQLIRVLEQSSNSDLEPLAIIRNAGPRRIGSFLFALRVSDPDPDSISVSGSVFGIRIRVQEDLKTVKASCLHCLRSSSCINKSGSGSMFERRLHTNVPTVF
jgi:hypothetical protein